MELPKDPAMLVSVINMKLRDSYPSLDFLCDDLNLDKKQLCSALKSYGFEYSEKLNKFW